MPYLLSFCVTTPKRLRQLNSNLFTTIHHKPMRLLKKYVLLWLALLPPILLVLLDHISLNFKMNLNSHIGEVRIANFKYRDNYKYLAIKEN